jgi:hypothetical protein
MARARITGVLEGEVVIKNLSITGCCLECTAETEEIKPNEKYIITIDPEASSQISSFGLEVECKWVRKSGVFTEIGFNIITSPKGKQFQDYVDFLDYYPQN